MVRISVTTSFKALANNVSEAVRPGAEAGHGESTGGCGSDGPAGGDECDGLVGFGAEGGGTSVELELRVLWVGGAGCEDTLDGGFSEGALRDLARPEGPGVGSLEILLLDR